jgi:hypothetical protein
MILPTCRGTPVALQPFRSYNAFALMLLTTSMHATPESS